MAETGVIEFIIIFCSEPQRFPVPGGSGSCGIVFVTSPGATTRINIFLTILPASLRPAHAYQPCKKKYNCI